jgi:altronate dehydratase large subunit
MMDTFLGYERENGTVGIRNWVGVLSAMDNVNPVNRGVCANVAGTLSITTLFVRGQFGRDEEITVRSLVGLGSNPNIAACLVVGLEPTTTMRLVDAIKKTGKRVESVIVQEAGGTIEALAQAIRKAEHLVIAVSRERRKPFPLSKLTIGVECGGSDTTSGCASNPAIGVVADRIADGGGQVIISETSEFLGAEHIFADRAVNPAVRADILAAVARVEDGAKQRGVDIRGANPVADNIRGGLTTIEEKALGAMVKSGTRAVQGVLGYSEGPTSPGVFMMDTPAPAVESITALAAGGCQAILFSTGVGNSIGAAVTPTIKITGNHNTATNFADNIDADVSAILTDGQSIDIAGQQLLDLLLDVASGTMTTSEVLGQTETGISRFEPTI